AVPVGRHGRLHDHALGVRAGQVVLDAVLDPLDRLPQSAGEQRDQRLLDEDVCLEPESAADVGGDDLDGPFGHADGGGDHGADEVRHLRGGPYGQLAGTDVVVGHHAAGLQRCADHAAGPEALGDDHVSAGERLLDVTAVHLDVGDVVVGDVLVQHRRPGA